MNAAEASRARARLWGELKPLLVRSLGREGAAEWMDWAAAQMRVEALRARQPIELKAVEWAP